MRFLTLHTSGTIRLRLTLWYGGLFFLAGVILLLANFVLVSQNFPVEHDDFRDRAAQRLGIPPDVFAPGGNIEFPARPPRPGGENRLTLVRVGVFFDEIGAQLKAETLEQLVWQSTLLLSVMSMTSVGVGWWIAGRMLRPLTEITDTVRRISDESLYERVRLTGPHDELRELADQFDVMLERLESAFRAQRNFVSDASHELRTPLTVIRTEVDVSLTGGDATADEQRHVAEVVRSAIARSEALIEALLILARADALLGSAETLSLVALSNQVLDSRATEVEAAGLRLERELAAIDVIGDRVLLERLIDNLVQNAIVHNERGGWLRVTTSQEADEACLVVSNSGVRIGATEVERLFKRFQRGDESRSRGKETAAVSGYGLGLSIVRAVAEHHGGKATAHALLDGGLEVTVRFPR